MREPSLVSLTLRRERWWRRVRPVLAAIMLLLVGIWVGGHPYVLPGPLADALGASDARVVADAIDKVDAAYIEEVDEARLTDAAIAGVVRELDDAFSSYLTASEYGRFKDATPRSLARHRRHRARHRSRPAGAERPAGLAGRARRHLAR